MPSDFKDAAERHRIDAEILLDEGHLANADHLFGMGAECSLKAVMVGLGMDTHHDGTPKDKAHKVHVNVLWAAFQSFAQGRTAARYLEPIGIGSPFSDWDVHQRYARRDRFVAETVTSHKKAALRCERALRQAQIDGILQ
jgi:hypothetical protein